MALKFHVNPEKVSPRNDEVALVLRSSSWDDYGFGTTFSLYLAHEQGEELIGNTKIARLGQVSNGAYSETTYTQLDPVFEELKPDQFSVGQDAKFYLTLIDLLGADSALAATRALHDLAAMDAISDEVIEQRVTQRSLLRYVTLRTVLDQYRDIVHGHITPQSFSLIYRPSPENPSAQTMNFDVDPESVFPSNLHVIIGPNGMGKTTALRRIASALDVSDPDHRPEFVAISEKKKIAGLVSVSFSAFDIFPVRDRLIRSQAEFRVTRVGLPIRVDEEDGESATYGTGRRAPLPALDETDHQKRYWEKLVGGCLSDRPDRLLSAFRLLAEADQVLQSAGITDPDTLLELDFVGLSSGHKIVLLTVCSLVRYCEAKTLVLIDEPESHLHPPLLGAFARALSNLMSETNSLAIVATHSPVVLQEVPSNCAWKVWSLDGSTVLSPPSIQTFGENLGVLTEEVFGLELDKSGYHSLLREVAARYDNYELAKHDLNGRLGEEAKVLLRSMIALKTNS